MHLVGFRYKNTASLMTVIGRNLKRQFLLATCPPIAGGAIRLLLIFHIPDHEEINLRNLVRWF